MTALSHLFHHSVDSAPPFHGETTFLSLRGASSDEAIQLSYSCNSSGLPRPLWGLAMTRERPLAMTLIIDLIIDVCAPSLHHILSSVAAFAFFICLIATISWIQWGWLAGGLLGGFVIIGMLFEHRANRRIFFITGQ